MFFRFSQHAMEKLRQRCIQLAIVEAVLKSPQQMIEESGKKVFQSKLERSSGSVHLLRVIVSFDVDPPVVLTAYWTDRIEKYWRQS